MTNSVSSNRPEKYNIVAFFSGVGGIELGFEQTNEFRVVYANEFDKYARQTYQLNHPDTYLDGRDIHDVQPEDIPAERVDVIWEVSLARPLVLQVIARALMMIVGIFSLNCFA